MILVQLYENFRGLEICHLVLKEKPHLWTTQNQFMSKGLFSVLSPVD